MTFSGNESVIVFWFRLQRISLLSTDLERGNTCVSPGIKMKRASLFAYWFSANLMESLRTFCGTSIEMEADFTIG